MMASIRVVKRQKSAKEVMAAAETHAERVGEAIQAKLAPFLQEGQAVPNIALVILLAAGALQQATDSMVFADEAYTDELSDDEQPRDKRDKAQEALVDELVGSREWMIGLFGAAAIRELGFSDATPREATLLSRFTGEVITALTTKELPAPRRKGVTWDAKETVDKLAELRADLDKWLGVVAREVREAQGAMVTRDRAMDAYDATFADVTNLLVGLFTFAGEKELADRVRPSSRRPGQREVDAPPAEAPQTDKAKDA